MRAYLVVDHGSRRERSNRRLSEVADLLRERVEDPVEFAHMELAPPSIADGFRACVERGASEVVVLPYFLGPGRHANEDVPRLVEEAAAAHPGVRYKVGPALGPHPLLADLLLIRAGLPEK
ncbi:MAG: CbiX/SirB N-terminal domain-containing protein [Sandaracinaceae bacterium]